jgi:hypothetical protein
VEGTEHRDTLGDSAAHSRGWGGAGDRQVRTPGGECEGVSEGKGVTDGDPAGEAVAVVEGLGLGVGSMATVTIKSKAPSPLIVLSWWT